VFADAANTGALKVVLQGVDVNSAASDAEWVTAGA